VAAAVLCAVISIAGLAGCSKGYVSEKISGGLSITLKAERYPLVRGDNKVTVTIVDSEKRTVTDAKVDMRFSMPPMPGMAPMDSKIQAGLNGDRYITNLIRRWKADGNWTSPSNSRGSLQ
jgi:hypothetical protein